MARHARAPSPTGIFHVMVRGINRMDIFLNDEDRYKYYDILIEVKKKYNYALYSYCFMDNHVHLLLHEKDSPLSDIMKSIGIRYSMYFNKKTGRIGSLVQNRYRSEPIISEEYFLTCARYIHNNPVKAGIATKPENYRWSSYRSYWQGTGEDMVDCAPLLALYGGSLDSFGTFTCTYNEDKFMEYPVEDIQRERDEVISMLHAHNLNLKGFPGLSRERRKAILQLVKRESGLSCRKIAELFGISKDAVFRA